MLMNDIDYYLIADDNVMVVEVEPEIAAVVLLAAPHRVDPERRLRGIEQTRVVL